MRMQLRHRRSAALFALLFALLFSTLLAGRQRNLLIDQHSLRQQGEVSNSVGEKHKGAETEQSEALAQEHARMLKAVSASDYGSYDPSPSMEKPHFKLIPN